MNLHHPRALPRPPGSAAPWWPLSSTAARPPAPELAQATSSRFPPSSHDVLRRPGRRRTLSTPQPLPRTLRPPKREGLEGSGCPTQALAAHLQQLHVAGGEPATEPVVLLAFPPSAVRDLKQREQLARSEAQPLAVPLPREGVQGPAAGAGHGPGARAHSTAHIPAEPRGLARGCAGSQAPGAPGSRALGARRGGAAQGSPGFRAKRAACRGADARQQRWFRGLRGLRRASGDAPGPGGSAVPRAGRGAGLRRRRPGGRGLTRQLPGAAAAGDAGVS